MSSIRIPSSPPRVPSGCVASEISVAQLVGQVYEAAPTAERSRLLEYLLRPLGVLAMVAIANGIFAKIRFRSGWPELHVPLDDVNRVQAGDITALVDRVQMVSTDAIDGLVGIVSASPVLAASAAAALLVALLVQKAESRSADDDDVDSGSRRPAGGSATVHTEHNLMGRHDVASGASALAADDAIAGNDAGTAFNRNADMGRQNFGVTDAGSWDDVGSLDIGGGDRDN